MVWWLVGKEWLIAITLLVLGGIGYVYVIKPNIDTDRVRDPRQDMPAVEPQQIRTGNSLEGTNLNSLLEDGHRVNCGIQVENWTQFPLKEPSVHLCGGGLSLLPHPIAPATKEAMVAVPGSGPNGSFGIVSWLIESKKRRLVIMWSCPYNHTVYSNRLAVGLTSEGVTDHPAGDQWFNLMYRGESNDQLVCKRGVFANDINPVVLQDLDFEVEGTMNTAHRAASTVTFKPRRPAN